VSNTPSLPPTAVKPSRPALIGATIEARLAAELERLIADQVSLDDFTPALQGYVLHGHRLALASVIPALTAAEQERDQERAAADRLHGFLYNPREPIRVGPSYQSIEQTRRQTYYGGTE
jgi:hypothetical protein